MIRKILHNLAENPILFEIFEKIFGADDEKMKIYRQAFHNGNRLLDFGCSTGNTTKAFLDFDYYGIDLDEGCIKYAQNRWKKHSNVKFFAKDIFKKPFKKEYFDYVLFAGTGHHIPDELFVPIVKELAYVLKKGGEIWFYDILKPSKSSPLLAKVLASLDRGRFIRTAKQYDRIFSGLKFIKIAESKVIKVTNTLIPQEDYCFYRLKKV
ncbi:hypothetical protein A3K29_03050 [Candidatus Collierbacteria bacterium RIFOXYB2_FULL_46_14]|uniref:Methyltransferase domain-containing protein n=1 Tax=Candidatus Collierbacteria bacterium GW2011_GWA2_46_26 TaxID=1618381 RepID=A0A0G1RV31_9BACT|nr:MAG: hypothetical protein UW29_C0004G0116 [Candidatus Collierbacteria bacterium GW2011_GWC2_44_13]KKU33833.1 MAG: hypothetical protein UX47_C0001G0116 [Candidatus Collierbacteria bacterium GW2011_GWA2_46_26]OGD73098.1 MAG: hypothetical protein A3K29_03050 [Candidatus Collierbacteria bacterium RIFOXYB2_FULL_46_14]OGD76140.1 MAG: hypothetical protein A3K43_03050 [Candidatus Collierbacteria bacterium RIFOXYA2_FULL_46_20]OGD77476.1 MAG: hypothetical protein A3K39_03050 [Candidatus Collierbacteri